MRKRIVAIYARVSSAKEAQLYALENQKQYYEEFLSRNPDWVLYKMYVDEGLSGTTTKKRESFLQMLTDAKDGKFDLIVTREVSRFARNTVDALICTRDLKRIGVEVYFIADNIWTMSEDDCELRLTIMATLAQNESKKISERSKAGQRISFMNGVLYGTGNILGYERVGRTFVVNEKQAEIVRRIFDLYLSGNGLIKICHELERCGYVSSTGLTKWKTGTVSGILKNPFYCGKIVYRKSYVEDYLTHKRIKNHGEMDQIEVQGSHQPLVSVEDFEAAQRILQSKASYQRNIGRGQKVSEDVWVRKMRCCCGKTLARRKWHRKKNDGDGQITYRCRSQIETGSITTRKNQGLSTDGICDSPWVQRWKLEVMLYTLFKHLWMYRDLIINNAMEALQESLLETGKKESINIEKRLKGYDRQLENLLDLYLDGMLEKTQYLKKKEKIENEKKQLQKENNSGIINSVNNINNIDIENRIQGICDLLKESFNEVTLQIPEEVIDVFVEKIIVHKNHFEWYVNCNPDAVQCHVFGNKKKHSVECSGDVLPQKKSRPVLQSYPGCTR